MGESYSTSTDPRHATLLAIMRSDPEIEARLDRLQTELQTGVNARYDLDTINMLVDAVREYLDEEPETADLVEPDLQDAPELLSTYLDELGKVRGEKSLDKLESMLDRVFDNKNEDHLKILTPYLDKCIADDTRNDVSSQRLMAFVRRTRRSHLLSHCPELCVDDVAFGFPKNFSEFLDSLDLSQNSMKKLSDVCFRLDADRVKNATPELLGGESVLEPNRIRVLLSLESIEVLPLISLLLAEGETWLVTKVARLLRKLEFAEAEGAALRTLEDDQMTGDYLLDLCEWIQNGADNPKLRDSSQYLLTQFIEEAESNSGSHNRRLLAIRALRFFPDEGTFHYLNDLATSGKFKLNKRAKIVREVAAETLEHIRGNL